MTKAIAIFIWLFVAAYSFYVLSHPRRGRERTGRRLVGIGALLVAASLAVPETPEGFNFGDILSVVSMCFAAIILGVGLVLAYPGTLFGQKPVDENEDPE